MFSAQIFQENNFLETKPFFFTGYCFPLTNFFNDKQTQESLESDFSETTFQKTNMVLMSLYYSNTNRSLFKTILFH
jgi:hypothetical protein